jgi:hypothetical protein
MRSYMSVLTSDDIVMSLVSSGRVNLYIAVSWCEGSVMALTEIVLMSGAAIIVTQEYI